MVFPTVYPFIICVVSKLGKKVFDKITEKDQNKPGEAVFGKTKQIVQSATRIALREGESDKVGDLSFDDFDRRLKDVLVNSGEFSGMEAKELIDSIFLDVKTELSDVIKGEEISNLRLYLQSSFNEIHNWIKGEIAEKLDEIYLSLMKDLRDLIEEQKGAFFKELDERLSNIKTIIFEGQVIGREVLNELQEAQIEELVELYKRLDIPLEVFVTSAKLIELSTFLKIAMGGEEKKLEETVKKFDEIINVISAEFAHTIVDTETLIKTGNVRLFKGEFEKALEYYDMVLTYHPENIVALSAKGMALYYSGNIIKAVEVLKKAIKVGGDMPETALSFANLGYILLLSGDFKGAAEFFNKAMDLNPDLWEVWNNMGQLLVENGDFETAIKYFDKALSIEHNAIILNNKGFALFNLGEFKQALIYFDMAIRAQENSSNAWANKALVLINLGRLIEALECCNKALEYQPSLAIAWTNKGLILSIMGRLEDALIHYNMAEKLEPNNPVIIASKSSILINIGKLFEALEYANRSIELQPKNPYGYNARGLVKMKMGKIIDAIEDFDKAVELHPKIPIIWFNRGMAYLEIGDSETANESFRKAVELDPNIWRLLDERRISI